jgi:hypothetical protein
MRSRLVLLIAALLALPLALLWLLAPEPSSLPESADTVSAPTPNLPTPAVTPAPPPPSEPPALAETAPAEPTVPQASPPLRGPLRIRAGEPIPELFPHQAERDAIQRLASTYDPARIPEIAAYLSHADATVREAARNGLIQLGDAAAIPHLRRARAETEAEKSLIFDAINYLSLPTADGPR